MQTQTRKSDDIMLFSELKQNESSGIKPNQKATFSYGSDKREKTLMLTRIERTSGWQEMEIESQASKESLYTEYEQMGKNDMDFNNYPNNEISCHQNLCGDYKLTADQVEENSETFTRTGRRKNSLIQ